MYQYNRFLPTRPTINPQTNEPYDYRTHINDPNSIYNVYDPKNMKAQLILYHWCRTSFVNGPAVADLHAFLFHEYPEITKRQMGCTLAQATTYKPNKLKGATKDNETACVTYVWGCKEDLQYGLEWMLSMWIWRLDHKWEDIHNEEPEWYGEMVNSIFEDVASCSQADLVGLYIDPIEESGVFRQSERADWKALWAKHGMTWEDKIRTVSKPRSLSSRW